MTNLVRRGTDRNWTNYKDDGGPIMNNQGTLQDEWAFNDRLTFPMGTCEEWEPTSSQGMQKPSEVACLDHLRWGMDPFAVMSEHSTTTGIRVYIELTPGFVSSISEIGDESELGSTGTCIGGRTRHGSVRQNVRPRANLGPGTGLHQMTRPLLCRRARTPSLMYSFANLGVLLTLVYRLSIR